MTWIQKPGPGPWVRSRDSATCTPRIRARGWARWRWRPISVSDVAARLSILAVHPVDIAARLSHHPRVAAAAALRAVDDERAWPQRHACQPARRDVDVGSCPHAPAQGLVGSATPSPIEDG